MLCPAVLPAAVSTIFALLCFAMEVPAVAGSACEEAISALASVSISSPAPAAYTRLYAHALESIFVFCTLSELHALSMMCVNWHRAVGSMRRIELQAKSHPLRHSRLNRHIVALGSYASRLDLNDAAVRIMPECLPNLRQLSCRLSTRSLPSLPLPPLIRLELMVRQLFATPPERPVHQICVNALLTSCVTLEELEISFPMYDRNFSFSVLQQLARLRDLALSWSHPPQHLTFAQVMQLRSLSNLTRFRFGQKMPSGVLCALMVAPVAQRWTDIGPLSDLSITESQFIAAIPELVTLNAEQVRCVSFDFLEQLPALRTLQLRFNHEHGAVAVKALTSSAAMCSHLTSLRLEDANITSIQLHVMLQQIPALSRLDLLNLPAVNSLQCLVIPTLAVSLRVLFLMSHHAAPLHPSDLLLLHGFQLRELILRSRFVPELQDADRMRFIVPSPSLPLLHKCHISR
jgi:hypothetical protein